MIYSGAQLPCLYYFGDVGMYGIMMFPVGLIELHPNNSSSTVSDDRKMESVNPSDN